MITSKGVRTPFKVLKFSRVLENTVVCGGNLYERLGIYITSQEELYEVMFGHEPCTSTVSVQIAILLYNVCPFQNYQLASSNVEMKFIKYVE